MIIVDAVLVGLDPVTKLEVWRRALGFFPDLSANTIKVIYSQFFVSNDIPLDEIIKSYYVINNPDGFDEWYNLNITDQMVGSTLGGSIIIPAINGTLQALPIDVIDGYILTDPQP